MSQMFTLPNGMRVVASNARAARFLESYDATKTALESNGTAQDERQAAQIAARRTTESVKWALVKTIA